MKEIQNWSRSNAPVHSCTFFKICDDNVMINESLWTFFNHFSKYIWLIIRFIVIIFLNLALSESDIPSYVLIILCLNFLKCCFLNLLYFFMLSFDIVAKFTFDIWYVVNSNIGLSLANAWDYLLRVIFSNNSNALRSPVLSEKTIFFQRENNVLALNFLILYKFLLVLLLFQI